MKTMKTFIAVTLAAVCAGFVSCSDDNDGPETGTKVNPATVFANGVPSQVGELVITKNAAGLVTRIVDGEEVTTFNYAPVKEAGSKATVRPKDYDITMNVTWGNDANGVDFYIKLNDKGYVEYAYEEDEDIYDGLQINEWWLKYNNLGQLIELKRTEGDNEVTTIKYNADGDITDVAVRDDHVVDKSKTTIKYTDTTHKASVDNKSGIMLYDASFRIDMDELAPAYFAGLLGKGTKHLPLSAVEINKGETGTETYTYNYAFTWTLNANGMPTLFKSTCNGEPDEDITMKW